MLQSVNLQLGWDKDGITYQTQLVSRIPGTRAPLFTHWKGDPQLGHDFCYVHLLLVKGPGHGSGGYICVCATDFQATFMTIRMSLS